MFSHVEDLLRTDLSTLLETTLKANDRVTRRYGLMLSWQAAA